MYNTYNTKLNDLRKTVCLENLGPVVQSIVSLTSSLRGQLVKYFTILLLNTLIFFVEKKREAFALQKLLKASHPFSTTNIGVY